MVGLASIPFVVEAVGDYLLIRANRKDIHWIIRVLLIVALWLLYGPGVALLACAPFCFFDPVLNKLRGRKWYYQSSTNGKFWDSLLLRFNHYAVLSGRVIIFVVILFVYVWKFTTFEI